MPHPALQPGLVDLHMTSNGLLPNGAQRVTDGDMEAAGVAVWTTFPLGVTADKRTDGPVSGTQYLRVSRNGTVGMPFAFQIFLTVGYTYRATGWARGDGLQPPMVHDGASSLWVGSSAQVWQYFDVTFVAGSTMLRLYGHAAGDYADFDDVRVEWCPRSTRNLGSLGGVAMLGDGLTAALYPTQLTPHGMRFDGSDDLLAYPSSAALSFGDGAGNDLPFSLESFGQFTAMGAGALVSKGAFGATLEYTLFFLGGCPEINVSNLASSAYIGRRTAAQVMFPGMVCHVVGTYDGSKTLAGLKVYLNALRVDDANRVVGAYAGMTPGGATLNTGFFAAVTATTGDIFNSVLYNYELTPGQVAQKYAERKAMLGLR